jgi:hypothetical protein
MKKIFGFAASLILVVVSANTQTVKKEHPPSPPKPKDEVVKFTPPKIVRDKEVQVKTEPPPPAKPKDEIIKFIPPKIVKDEEVQVKEIPVITITGKRADEFYKRNPSVAGISRQGNIVTIKRKDGTSEKYDMSKKEDDKSFTEKYGVSPIPPPPPPPIVVKEKKLS